MIIICCYNSCLSLAFIVQIKKKKNICSFFFSLPGGGIYILCMFLSFNFLFYQPLPLFLDFFAIQFKRFNKVVSDLVCKAQAKLNCNIFLS
jgi:hypothetical protein